MILSFMGNVASRTKNTLNGITGYWEDIGPGHFSHEYWAAVLQPEGDAHENNWG